jgi:hypothetical protein
VVRYPKERWPVAEWGAKDFEGTGSAPLTEYFGSLIDYLEKTWREQGARVAHELSGPTGEYQDFVLALCQATADVVVHGLAPRDVGISVYGELRSAFPDSIRLYAGLECIYLWEQQLTPDSPTDKLRPVAKRMMSPRKGKARFVEEDPASVDVRTIQNHLKVAEAAREVWQARRRADRPSFPIAASHAIDAGAEIVALGGYLDELIRRTGEIPRLFGSGALSMDDVFVPLVVRDDYRRAEERTSSPVPSASSKGRGRRGINLYELENDSRRSVIVGAPGAGKTTGLRWLAKRAAQRRKSDERACFPIYVECRRLEALDTRERKLPDPLEIAWLLGVEPCVQGLAEQTRTALRSLLARQRDQGRLAIYLDALDEELDRDTRHTIVQAFRTLTAGDGAVFVATSRPHGLGSRGFGLSEMELQPLSEHDADLFARRYLGDAALAARFRSAVEDVGLQDVVRSPFILKALVALYEREQGQLPSDTRAVYEKVVTLLTDELDVGSFGEKAIKFEVQADGTRLRRLGTEILALNALRAERRAGAPAVISREDILAAAAHAAGAAGEGAREALARDLQIVSLLERISDDRWQFRHLSLQEYLAASALARQGPTGIARLLREVRRTSDHPLRRGEVLLMLAGCVEDPRPVLRSLGGRGLADRARALRYVSVTRMPDRTAAEIAGGIERLASGWPPTYLLWYPSLFPPAFLGLGVLGFISVAFAVLLVALSLAINGLYALFSDVGWWGWWHLFALTPSAIAWLVMLLEAKEYGEYAVAAIGSDSFERLRDEVLDEIGPLLNLPRRSSVRLTIDQALKRLDANGGTAGSNAGYLRWVLAGRPMDEEEEPLAIPPPDAT